MNIAAAHCLAIFDWDKSIGCQRMFSALHGFLATADFSLKEFKVLSAGSHRARVVPKEVAEEEIKGSLDIKSIEGTFMRGRGQVSFLISGPVSSARIAFICVRGPCENVDLDLLIDVLAGICALTYGYTFHWHRNSEPAFYALGIEHQTSAEEDGEDADANERWFNERVLKAGEGAYKSLGLIRSVYETNILNESHLNKMIGGVSFKSVIEDRRFGSLRELANSNWKWCVPQCDINKIKDYVEAAGMLI